MPRFPVQPQRTSAPAALSNAPRAQAAHFGAGIGRHLADLGAGAAELGQGIEQRQKRQAEQQMSNFDRDLAKRRAESDAQAPPQEDSESRITRHQSLFESSADALLQDYQGQALHGRLSESIEARREAYRQKLLAREAQQRLRASLEDTQALVQQWSERVAKDPTEFANASLELFGDEASGEAGLLAGLGLRPEALAAWKTHSLNQFLDERMTSDPAGLIAELETGRWQDQLSEERREQLRAEAGEAQQRRASAEALELGQESAGAALQLSNDIGAGRAGQAEIRRAEEAGTLSAPQAEALRAEVARAEIARQAQQVAGDELALTFSTGIGFDPENPQNRRAADAFYEKAYSQALREGAAEEVVAQVVTMVAKTGYMPPRLAKDTTGLLHSGDDERRLAGATLYGGLRDAAPLLASLAFDPETRGRGGILKRWLDLGLEPPEALRRAEAEWPGDGSIQMLEPDELSALKRDLGLLFTGEHSGHRVNQILDQLEQNYLDDLGKGLPPRQARRQLRRDAGRVIWKLGRFKPALETYSDGYEQNIGGGQPMLHRVNSGVLPGPVPLPLPPRQADEQLSAAAALELERDLRNWAQRSNDEDLRDYFDNMQVIARLFPSIAASLFGFTMLSVGDGKNLLGKVLQEDGQTGIRSVAITHPEHGPMTIRQRRDISAEKYIDLDVTFWDREKREYVTERLPSRRFTLQPDFAEDASEAGAVVSETVVTDHTISTGSQAIVVPSDGHRPIIQPGPSADPVPTLPLPPSEAGPGRELVPDHTGGNQTELGPLLEQAPGFPAQEQEPLILVNPDQSDDRRVPLIVYNEEGTPIYDDIPISERFIGKAGQKHHTEDVWFDKKGYPIFDKYTIVQVEIELTGKREKDKRIATKKVLDEKLLPEIPDGYVWHHHQDMKTMQLVLKRVHDAVGHTGGILNFSKKEKKRD